MTAPGADYTGGDDRDVGLEDAPTPILRVAGDGAIHWANAAARGLVGPPESGTPDGGSTFRIRPSIADLLISSSGLAVRQAEVTLELPDGTRVLLVSLEPRRRPDGGLADVRVFACDITERKARESALRENGERLRWLIENTSEAIWRFELDQPCPISLPEDEQVELFYRHGYLAECNEAMARMYGFGSSVEMVGLRLPQILLRSDPKNEQFLRAFIRSGYRLIDAESVDLGKDGEIHHVCNSLVGEVRDGLGYRAWGATRDITERKRAELALRDGEERYRLAVEAANLGTWDLDPATGTATCSPRMFDLLGVEPGSPVTQDIFLSRVHPDDRERVRNSMLRAFDPTGGGIYNIEYRVLPAPEDPERWMAARGMAIFDEHDRIVRFIGATLDISARKRIQEALQEKTRELEHVNSELARSNIELEQFAYIASHDLQEPLRMVTNYLNLLQKRYGQQLDQKAGSFVREAVDGAKRMQALIRGLLDYSRVGAAHDPKPVDSDKALDDALMNLSQKVLATGATLSRGHLPKVFADQVLLAQVFQNLVGNALKFHGAAPPTIDITGVVREQDCLFTVKDNGIGIDPSNHENVFQIFRRLHTREEYPGTGIGLAAVKKIIERHNGRVWIESALGKGTTFLFTLPKAPPASRTLIRDSSTLTA